VVRLKISNSTLAIIKTPAVKSCLKLALPQTPAGDVFIYGKSTNWERTH
jgi:hypothetical protein